MFFHVLLHVATDKYIQYKADSLFVKLNIFDFKLWKTVISCSLTSGKLFFNSIMVFRTGDLHNGSVPNLLTKQFQWQ